MPKNAAPNSGFRSLEDAIQAAIEAQGPTAITNVLLRRLVPMASNRQIENSVNKLKMKGRIHHWRQNAKHYYTGLSYQGQTLRNVHYSFSPGIASLHAAFGMPTKLDLSLLAGSSEATPCRSTGGFTMGHNGSTVHLTEHPEAVTE